MLTLLLSLDPPFPSEVQIGESGYRNIEPHVAVNGNSVMVAWMKADIYGNTTVYYRYSGDGGSTWSSPQRLSNRCNGGVYGF